MEPQSPPVTSFNANDGASQLDGALYLQKKTATFTELPRALWLNARRVFEAISEPTRYRIVQEFATGARYTATNLSKVVGLDRRLVSKHLNVLRECGLVVEHLGTDRRFYINGILPLFLHGLQDGVYVVDFGSGVLRVPVKNEELVRKRVVRTRAPA